MDLSDRIAADRRLVILRLLKDQPDYALNSTVTQSALETFGHGVSRDVILSDLAWLAEQELVELEEIRADLVVAKIKSRGIDAANGVAHVPGVKRPGPGD